ncbi:MAG: Crp/Fnr family transcriptional regulator [Bacteroidota bacterium]
MIVNQLQPLIEHIRKRLDFTDAEANTFVEHFSFKYVKKRQFIVQPGFVPHHRNYVLEGALRGYVICNQGHDHTIQFAIEDWWISDYNAYIYQQPATMFVMALEDSKLLSISFDDEKKLKASHPKYETYFRIIAEHSTAYMQRRLVRNLTQDAEKRYESFLEKYPQIVQRVPQYALASYLGMTTEFLSRIRNKRVKKKS